MSALSESAVRGWRVPDASFGTRWTSLRCAASSKCFPGCLNSCAFAAIYIGRLRLLERAAVHRHRRPRFQPRPGAPAQAQGHAHDALRQSLGVGLAPRAHRRHRARRRPPARAVPVRAGLVRKHETCGHVRRAPVGREPRRTRRVAARRANCSSSNRVVQFSRCCREAAWASSRCTAELLLRTAAEIFEAHPEARFVVPLVSREAREFFERVQYRLHLEMLPMTLAVRPRRSCIERGRRRHRRLRDGHARGGDVGLPAHRLLSGESGHRRVSSCASCCCRIVGLPEHPRRSIRRR